jgi:hypothetical protein
MNQLASFVKKLPFEDASLQPEQAAWDKFRAAEHLCRRTNQRLRAEKLVGRERHSSIRECARQWIARVIGHKPDMQKIYERCDFGPGASLGVHGTATHRAAKLESESWTVTPTALPFALSAMAGEPLIWELLQQRSIFSMDLPLFKGLFHSKTEKVSANKIIMVPKTAVVHRTIAIEPLLNGLVQKGVDVYLRGRLRRFGLDLEDQESNSELARLGSLGGFNPFSTIDLSSASDSLSIGAVKDLLPPDWFSLMSALRSPSYESEWGCGRYHKFVSMGNGFCFPLETLIFASIAYAVGVVTGDSEFRVYGDDIIVHQRAALLVVEVLKFYGFRTNIDKTFFFGPFRESCGADFYEGVPVRPYNLDFVPKTDWDIYKVYNGMRLRHPDCPQAVLDAILAPIPVKERLYRPVDGPPAGAATVPIDVFMGHCSSLWNRDYQSWSWHEYVDTGVSDPRRPSPATEMYGALSGNSPLTPNFRKDVKSDDMYRPEFTFRRRTKTRVKLVPSSQSRAAPSVPLYGRIAPFLQLEWRLATSVS